MKRGEIVTVKFPFSDYSDFKLRPALIISSNYINKRSSNIIILAMSSVIRKIRKDDILIKESDAYFLSTGLTKSSLIRCESIIYIDKKILHRKLGFLHSDILKKVDEKVMLALGLN